MEGDGADATDGVGLCGAMVDGLGGGLLYSSCEWQVYGQNKSLSLVEINLVGIKAEPSGESNRDWNFWNPSSYCGVRGAMACRTGARIR